MPESKLRLSLAMGPETAKTSFLAGWATSKTPIKERKPKRMSWLSSLRRYLLVTAVGNLTWEFAQMPLYTLWETGTLNEIAFAAIHCTGGDILIALSALTVALVLFGTHQWPEEGLWHVALPAITIGLGYTLFSEWLNIEIREVWTYRDLMPVIPVANIGLSPLAQWIVIPALAFWWAGNAHEHGGSSITDPRDGAT